MFGCLQNIIYIRCIKKKNHWRASRRHSFSTTLLKNSKFIIVKIAVKKVLWVLQSRYTFDLFDMLRNVYKSIDFIWNWFFFTRFSRYYNVRYFPLGYPFKIIFSYAAFTISNNIVFNLIMLKSVCEYSVSQILHN